MFGSCACAPFFLICPRACRKCYTPRLADGLEVPFESGKLMTLFSAPRYGGHSNSGTILEISRDLYLQCKGQFTSDDAYLMRHNIARPAPVPSLPPGHDNAASNASQITRVSQMFYYDILFLARRRVHSHHKSGSCFKSVLYGNTMWVLTLSLSNLNFFFFAGLAAEESDYDERFVNQNNLDCPTSFKF